MKVIEVTKNCYCVPTRYGKFLNWIYSPLWWMAHNKPKLYLPIYRFLIKHSKNFEILVRSGHIMDKRVEI